MSTTYSLTCECGRTIAVRPQQAGSSISCECGRMVDVPRLGELRRNAVVATADAATNPTSRWELRDGVPFSLGALVMLLALGSLAFLIRQDQRLMVDAPTLSDFEFTDDPRNWPAPVAFERWTQIRDVRLGGREEPYFVTHRIFRRQLRTLMAIATVFLLVGGGAVATPFLRKRSAAKR